ncbi:hypothetical protein PPL_12144 [Heterostelium album PN500]|uniref:Uncharacterized protein n=1 Tax=Heterostelium pallidum (strain ATCC 26659 / Pp 5 / PN500) TaxID=670386 RepID=D3BLU0_HETP5|nr:hypothetical protein PPL_12144 [Heterostelium album PN500]EFA77541.1 hypothetical protein PPL_12144 [Heterostelium album PN500]|eukprot:XP_020429669.1 hypothetical protein PPL_12144 [Heterostelium album PN500]
MTNLDSSSSKVGQGYASASANRIATIDKIDVFQRRQVKFEKHLNRIEHSILERHTRQHSLSGSSTDNNNNNNGVVCFEKNRKFKYSELDEEQRRRVLNIFANYKHHTQATIPNHGLQCDPIDPPEYREDTSVANNTEFTFHFRSDIVALLVIDFLCRTRPGQPHLVLFEWQPSGFSTWKTEFKDIDKHVE